MPSFIMMMSNSPRVSWVEAGRIPRQKAVDQPPKKNMEMQIPSAAMSI